MYWSRPDIKGDTISRIDQIVGRVGDEGGISLGLLCQRSPALNRVNTSLILLGLRPSSDPLDPD